MNGRLAMDRDAIPARRTTLAVTKMKIRPGTEGKAQFSVSAKGLGMPDSLLPALTQGCPY